METKNLGRYIDLLKQHDWAYQYSEDAKVWRLGSSTFAAICKLQQELDPQYVTWNAYAPPDCRVSL